MAVIVVLSGRCGPWCATRWGSGGEQLGSREAQPLYGGEDLGPLVFQEPGALVLHQCLAGALADEHAAPAPFLDQLLVHQLLVALEHRQWVQPELRSHTAYRR